MRHYCDGSRLIDTLQSLQPNANTIFNSVHPELCRGRAGESTSIEELAMHRALAVHVRDRFLGPGVVRGARAGMVNTAVEVSLNYQSLACVGRSNHKPDTKDKPKPFHAKTQTQTKKQCPVKNIVASPQRDYDGKENKKPDKVSPRKMVVQKQLRVSHSD